jgi:outer membrane protein TolC
MTLRISSVMTALLALASSAQGQLNQEVPSSSAPRTDLPFAIEPDRLPGPPRSMGELPQGSTQPPSTLPGRVFNQPPRAMGEAPDAPGSVGISPFSPFSPGLPRLPGEALQGTTTIPPFGPPGSTMTGREGTFFLPGLIRSPVGPTRPGDLPPALPESWLTNPVPSRPENELPPLSLEEVLQSVESTYPPFQSILQDRELAAGDLLSAEGAFDLNLNADSRNYPLGYYNRSVQDVFLEQPLMRTGGKVFAGYRLATGRYPNYYDYLNTRSGGAFVSGFELPLKRNRAIDAKRAKLMQSEIERQKVEPSILKTRITLRKDVAKTYWSWVAAGQTSMIYRDLIRVAEARKIGLEVQVREGIGRPIDMVDFQRVLLSRQQQSVVADRRFQQSTIELSLYLRDKYCFPILPPPTRLPTTMPEAVPPDPQRLVEDIDVALRLRPEILSLRLEARKADIDRQYARNQLQPSLNLYVYTEQNVGNRVASLGPDFRPFIMESSLLFDVPIQRRYARGRVTSAEAAIRQVMIRTRYASDRIRADVQDATSALIAAYEQVVRYRENEAVNRRLERAEETALREGTSTVLFLNLREQSTSDAQAARVDAEAKFQTALADYQAALGIDAILSR